MKLSIAMATYNGAKYVNDQLDSFLRQSRPPDEVVIADDGSTDDTLQILETFRLTAPFHVKVLINESNIGYAANFNRALCAAEGDLIFLSDQDDVWFANKLEKMKNLFSDNPDATVVMCDALLTDAELHPVGVTKIGQIRAGGMGMSRFVMGCCAAVDKAFLEKVLPIPECYPSHDSWIVGIADGINRKTVLQEPLQYYRRHGANESEYIANRTTPITRTSVLLKKSLDGMTGQCSRTSTIRRNIDTLNQMKDGVRRAIARPDNRWLSSFAEFEKTLTHRINNMAKRVEVCNRPRISRPIHIMRLWRRGIYMTANGYKSALSDLLVR